MRKQLVLSNNDVINFVSNARARYLYQKTFGKDILFDVMRLSKSTDRTFDQQLILQMSWVFAKNADHNIGTLSHWLNSLDEFPLVEMTELLPDLVNGLGMFNKVKNRRRR